jgi:hypothetical protein
MLANHCEGRRFQHYFQNGFRALTEEVLGSEPEKSF